ncbi:MAG: Fic family protein [Eubacterium sp.]
MTTVQGITKLPISVKNMEALKIFEILAETNLKIGQISTKLDCSIVNKALVQIFSLNESIQSARIEGTQVTFSDIIEEKKKKNRRWEITEVINYQNALYEGAQMISQGASITSKLIKELHEIMMNDGRGTTHAIGEYRNIQNFIGPTNKIEDAVYLPVEANEILDYMQNLEDFIQGKERKRVDHKMDDDIFVFDSSAPPLVKTAIMHAQFESIHPFLDGNGRMGRILIAINLIKEKLIEYPIFLVSEELEKEKNRYYDLLNGVRGNDPDWAAWIIFFLNACNRMSDNLLKKLNEADELAREGLDKCDTKIEEEVWIYTIYEPVVTAAEVAESIKISQTTARKALNNLSDKGLIYGDKSVKRNRKFRNYDLMRVLRE